MKRDYIYINSRNVLLMTQSGSYAWLVFFAVYFFMDIIEESQIVKNIKIPPVCLSMILEHPIYSGDSDV